MPNNTKPSFFLNGINTLDGIASYTENNTAVVLDSSVQIYDAELSAQGHYAGASITLRRQGGANSQDVFSASGNLIFSGNDVVLSGVSIGTAGNSNGTLTISFNSNATQTRVNEALSSLAYSNTSDNPPASVQIDWIFSDGNSGAQGTGGALSVLGSSTVNITATNDAPTGAATAVLADGSEDMAYTLKASDLLQGFNDADGDPLSVTHLTATNGTLAAAAGGWTFTPNANYNGSAQLNYSVVDGNGGSIAAMQGFNLAAVNDAPSFQVEASVTTTNHTHINPYHTSGEKRNLYAFAMIKNDGSVVTWGVWWTDDGGDSSAVADQLDGTIDVVQIYSSPLAFAALRADGSVVTWGNSAAGGDSNAVASQLDGTVDVVQIYSTGDTFNWNGAFAALRVDGSVVTWGNAQFGGDSGLVTAQLDGTIDVVQIYSSSFSFAAIRADGSVVTWGGGEAADSSAVANLLDGSIDIKQIASSQDASAALRADGSVVTWGYALIGGDQAVYYQKDQFYTEYVKAYSVADQLNGEDVDVTEIYANESAFAALRADGSVVTWGFDIYGANSSAVASELDGTVDVVSVYSSEVAFAALRVDGSVVTWGAGGDSSAVADQLDGTIDVVQIYSNNWAFAALRADGSVVTWGADYFGGNSSAVANQLNGDIDVVGIYSSSNHYYDEGAFAALRADGSVVTWGSEWSLGDSSAVASQLNGDIDVVQIYTNDIGFTALRADGSVVTWGGDDYGSDSSAVASQISSGVVGGANIFTDDVFVPARPLSGGTVSFTENSTPVVLENHATVSDPDLNALNGGAGNYDGATLTLQREGFANADDVFSSAVFSGATVIVSGVTIGTLSQSGGVLTIHFNTNASQTLVNSVLQQIAYSNTSDAPPAAVTIAWTFNDGNVSGQGSGGALAALGTTTVTITPINDTPIGTATAVLADGAEDTVYTLNAADLMLGFSDPDGDVLAVGNLIATHGILSPIAGGWTFTPELDFSGQVDLAYNVVDGQGASVAATHSFTVAAGNDAPSLTAPAVITYVDTAMDDNFVIETGALFATDIDSGSLSFGIVGGTDNGDGTVSKLAAYGTLTVTQATGAYRFTPNDAAIEPLKANASSSFTVTVSDGLLTDNKSLVININQNGVTESVGNDVLVGTSGNNVINGLAGADTMTGGLGNDSYYVDNVRDVVVETSTLVTEIDMVFSGVNFTLGNNIENLTLIGSKAINGIGNTLDNTIVGNNADNTLDGGQGADKLQGGLGNDVYQVDNSGDIVTEAANAGLDTVKSSISYILTTNVENLTLTGSAAINGIGNSVANTLIGNTAANTLNGSGGADTLVGGLGNDVYLVDNAGDVVRETSALVSETDLVKSSVTYKLGNNLENLTLTGSTAINGTGNALDNTLTGNAMANILTGDAGVDSLNGGDGMDVLVGGLGKDKISLKEITSVTDTVKTVAGDSLITAYDSVSQFALGNGVTATTVDRLDLDNTKIAANAGAVNGVNVGIIKSHAISNGIVSFDDTDTYTSPLTLVGGNIKTAFQYLQATFIGGETVAFTAVDSTYVFQDNGVNDTAVQLTGVVASNLNTDGLAAGGVWLV